MRKLLLIPIVTLTLGCSSLAAIAATDEDGCAPPHHPPHGLQKPDRRAMMDRQLTASQIQTLVEARIIMQGNEQVKLGKIEETDSGFTVFIVGQDNKIAEQLELAPNGMPLEMYQRLQKRKHKLLDDAE